MKIEHTVKIVFEVDDNVTKSGVQKAVDQIHTHINVAMEELKDISTLINKIEPV